MNFWQKILRTKPYLVWFVKDKNNLSLESKLENLLNYGGWKDYLQAENELGIEKIRNIFENLKSRKRVNLRPKTINFFNLYFAKYAR